MMKPKFVATLEQVKAFRKATGCAVGMIRPILEAMEPGLRQRMLIAVQTQDGPIFHDPIEDDPAFKQIIENAHHAACKLIEASGLANRRGACHGIWDEQARILKDEHDIVWYSCREMNPGSCFD